MSPEHVLNLVRGAPRGAVFSPDRLHRYLLWRRILQRDLLRPDAGVCLFNMLNPSKADERIPDPTVTRALDYATRWGCWALLVTNMYGWRSTNKDVLPTVDDPVGPDNDAWIRAAASAADIVVAGWGDGPDKLDVRPRARAVLHCIARPVVCLGITEAGHPRHPLYRPADFEPLPYSAALIADG